MGVDKICLRFASVEDVPELLGIYAYYVENTAITFEYDVPSQEEFESRMRNIMKKFPYLVAEINGRIVGYSYVATFKGRAAYDWTVETTVYIRKDCMGMGIGRKLYEALEKILIHQNILNMEACIATPVGDEDEYLTRASVKFHERMGYRLVGEFQKCGYKFGKWYNMVWMEKHIGEHATPHPAVIAFEEIRGQLEEIIQ